MDHVVQSLSLLVFLVGIIGHNGCFGTISCFVCSSRNGSHTACDDPFNAGGSPYVERCRVPRKGYEGEFPAHFCIKIIGVSYSTQEKIVIRRCTTETWQDQCGRFKFEDELIRGCILTCDLDGCNSSNVFKYSQPLLFICTTACLLLGLSSSLLSMSSATSDPSHSILGCCILSIEHPLKELPSLSKLSPMINREAGVLAKRSRSQSENEPYRNKPVINFWLNLNSVFHSLIS